MHFKQIACTNPGNTQGQNKELCCASLYRKNALHRVSFTENKIGKDASQSANEV